MFSVHEALALSLRLGQIKAVTGKRIAAARRKAFPIERASMSEYRSRPPSSLCQAIPDESAR